MMKSVIAFAFVMMMSGITNVSASCGGKMLRGNEGMKISRVLKNDKEKNKEDKKDKKDKKIKGELYGCVCEQRQFINVFNSGRYVGQQTYIDVVESYGSFVESVEPKGIEDVPPCECIYHPARELIPIEDSGRFENDDQKNTYLYEMCEYECPGHTMYLPVIYGGVCYLSLIHI